MVADRSTRHVLLFLFTRRSSELSTEAGQNAHGGGALVTVRAAEDDGTYVEQVSREFLPALRLCTG